jgi:hypothetical protein
MRSESHPLSVAPSSPYTVWQKAELLRAPWNPSIDNMADAQVFAPSPARTVAAAADLAERSPPPGQTSPQSAPKPAVVPEKVLRKPAAATTQKKPAMANKRKAEEADNIAPVCKKPAAAAKAQRSAKKATALVQKKISEPEANAKEKTTEDEADEDFEVGFNGEELRDPTKAKKFMLALTKGTLPQPVMEAYAEADAKLGDGKRAETTKVINRFFKRLPNGKLEPQAEHPIFAQRRIVERSGYQDEWHEGVVWEEAVTRCRNSEDALKNAVTCQRIKASGNGGWENLVYHFPRSRVGGATTYRRVEEGSRVTTTTDDMFDKLDEAISSLLPQEGHVLGMTDSAISTLATKSRGGASATGSSSSGSGLTFHGVSTRTVRWQAT